MAQINQIPGKAVWGTPPHVSPGSRAAVLLCLIEWLGDWSEGLQVVLAPHVYCPEVSGATACFSGQSLYDSLDKSVGYLTVAPGWCVGSNCKVTTPNPPTNFFPKTQRTPPARPLCCF